MSQSPPSSSDENVDATYSEEEAYVPSPPMSDVSYVLPAAKHGDDRRIWVGSGICPSTGGKAVYYLSGMGPAHDPGPQSICECSTCEAYVPSDDSDFGLREGGGSDSDSSDSSVEWMHSDPLEVFRLQRDELDAIDIADAVKTYTDSTTEDHMHAQGEPTKYQESWSSIQHVLRMSAYDIIGGGLSMHQLFSIVWNENIANNYRPAIARNFVKLQDLILKEMDRMFAKYCKGSKIREPVQFKCKFSEILLVDVITKHFLTHPDMDGGVDAVLRILDTISAGNAEWHQYHMDIQRRRHLTEIIDELVSYIADRETLAGSADTIAGLFQLLERLYMQQVGPNAYTRILSARGPANYVRFRDATIKVIFQLCTGEQGVGKHWIEAPGTRIQSIAAALNMCIEDGLFPWIEWHARFLRDVVPKLVEWINNGMKRIHSDRHPRNLALRIQEQKLGIGVQLLKNLIYGRYTTFEGPKPGERHLVTLTAGAPLEDDDPVPSGNTIFIGEGMIRPCLPIIQLLCYMLRSSSEIFKNRHVLKARLYRAICSTHPLELGIYGLYLHHQCIFDSSETGIKIFMEADIDTQCFYMQRVMRFVSQHGLQALWAYRFMVVSVFYVRSINRRYGAPPRYGRFLGE